MLITVAFWHMQIIRAFLSSELNQWTLSQRIDSSILDKESWIRYPSVLLSALVDYRSTEEQGLQRWLPTLLYTLCTTLVAMVTYVVGIRNIYAISIVRERERRPGVGKRLNRMSPLPVDFRMQRASSFHVLPDLAPFVRTNNLNCLHF